MNYFQLREAFLEQIVFTTHQVYAWQPRFDKNNLSRWVRKGYLVKLRNGYYLFSDYQNLPNVALFLANRLYRPSYISLHAALAFYNLIPEAVGEVTSITTQKTKRFGNAVGHFAYQSVKPASYFGYKQLPFTGGHSIWLATPEKALIDLLYLYPFYKTRRELLTLRLDSDLISELIDPDIVSAHLERIKSPALEKRVGLMLQLYLYQ